MGGGDLGKGKKRKEKRRERDFYFFIFIKKERNIENVTKKKIRKEENIKRRERIFSYKALTKMRVKFYIKNSK